MRYVLQIMALPLPKLIPGFKVKSAGYKYFLRNFKMTSLLKEFFDFLEIQIFCLKTATTLSFFS